MDKIDSLFIGVPADGIDAIGIGAHSVNETSEPDHDPKRAEMSSTMTDLWNNIAAALTNDVVTFGLCDMETDVFFELFKSSVIKPNIFQVNLTSCCMVPEDLKKFANANNIKLQTHADPPSILSPGFMEGIDLDDTCLPQWIIRYQLFIKARGVLQDKRYLIPA